MHTTPPASTGVDSAYAWTRLWAALALMTLGGIGMYSMAVALPAVQAEFGVARSMAALPYALAMLGVGLGSVLMGHLADRKGIVISVRIGIVCLGAGLVAAGSAPGLWQFAAAQGLLIGMLGSAATFAPLVADISHWFARRRGLAVGICASGNYLAGAVWPPVLQHYFDTVGWRQTFIGAGLFCVAAMLPLSFLLRRPRPRQDSRDLPEMQPEARQRPLGLAPHVLLALLCTAGVACCVAMAMPQVHIVAYCGDLGYAAARGAEMLSLMLGFGIVSRLASGWLSDHIGGLKTLLVGSSLQALALAMFLPAEGLVTLYLVSALFGLFQGGIVPSYAIILREHFEPQKAGVSLGWVILATLIGMALGGWLSGAIFDLTGSYRAAFVNGILWSALNISIAVWLLRRTRQRTPAPVSRTGP